MATLPSIWQKRLVRNKTWKVIPTVSSDCNHLNAIHHWILLKLKCNVCYQTQAVKGGARVLWCIKGLHIGRAFSCLIRSCVRKDWLNICGSTARRKSWPCSRVLNLDCWCLYRLSTAVCAGFSGRCCGLVLTKGDLWEQSWSIWHHRGRG